MLYAIIVFGVCVLKFENAFHHWEIDGRVGV